MKNKKLKIALQSASIIALFCIVPTCVISCSNSQSSSNSNTTNNQNNNSSINFIDATVSSANNYVTKSNYQSYLESISDNILSSAQANDAGNYFDSWINVYATSNNSVSPSSYTISLNNFSNSSYTYSWYVISETQWDNVLQSNIQSVETSKTFSQHQTEQNIIHECIENNSVISNKESYTFDKNIPSTGQYFVCVIKNSQNTWYSKPVLLYSNNSTSSNSQQTPINNLNISSYSLKLASKNSTINNNGNVQINVNQGEKVTFDLELKNQNNQNLTFSDFSKIKYYVEYVFTNINTTATITSTKLDLSQASSWTYSINSSGYWTVSVNVYNQNNNEISINNNGSNYQIVSQYVTINWENEEIKYQGSGTIQIKGDFQICWKCLNDN